MSTTPKPTIKEFRDPIGILRRCHQHVLEHCELMDEVATKVEKGEVGLDTATTAVKVQRFFSTTAKKHHQDEVEDIFPYLVRQSLKLADIIHQLNKEYQRQDEEWPKLSPQLMRPSAITAPAEFRTSVDNYIASIQRHITLESEELFEIAQHILSTDELRRIGKSMAERRGIRLPLDF
jgi:hemerythrin-like domain-containing protein